MAKVYLTRQGSALEFDWREGMTLQDLIDLSELQTNDSTEFYINGESTQDTDVELNESDRVVVAGAVKGA